MFLSKIKTCIIIIIIFIIIIIVFLCMTEYRNEVFNMTVVTLGGFVGKICSRIGPLLEES